MLNSVTWCINVEFELSVNGVDINGLFRSILKV